MAKKRGPKPRSSALKVLASDGTSTKAQRVSTSKGKVPECPFPLSGEAAEEYARFAPVLHEKGLLTQEYAPAFACYCLAYAINHGARAELENALVLTTDSGGCKANPAGALALKSIDMMLKVLGKFGCTPVDRAKMKLIEEAKPADPLAMFLNANG